MKKGWNTAVREDGADKYFARAKRVGSIRKVIFFLIVITAILLIYSEIHYLFFSVVYFCLTAFYIVSERLLVDKYLFQAEEVRRKHAFENAFQIVLTDVKSTAYYNNAKEAGPEKYVLNQMESIFFSAFLLKKDSFVPVFKLLFAIVVAGIAVCFKQNKLFEFVLSFFLMGYLAVEYWEKCCYVKKLEALFSTIEEELMKGPKDGKRSRLMALAMEYEAVKAYYKVPVKSKIFMKYKDALTAEWEEKVKAYETAIS